MLLLVFIKYFVSNSEKWIFITKINILLHGSLATKMSHQNCYKPTICNALIKLPLCYLSFADKIEILIA